MYAASTEFQTYIIQRSIGRVAELVDRLCLSNLGAAWVLTVHRYMIYMYMAKHD